MSLKQQLQDDMKAAMRTGEKDRLGVIRMALAALKQVEVDERIDLSSDDSRALAILDKMVKQRRESIAQYEKAGREELAAVERAEIDVLQTWLPEQLDDAEIDQMIAAAIAESGAESMRDMGKVMGILKPQLAGRADMGAVSGRIKARLSS